MTTEAPAFEVDDAIVLLLGAPSRSRSLQGRIDGITRLEKLIFLLERETPLGKQLTETPAFTSHNFGPFSSKIYQAVETLAAAELVDDSAELTSSTEDAWEFEQVVGIEAQDPYATRNFTLTERGRRYYAALLRELPKGTESTVEEFKARYGALPLRQLIRYVYQTYPEYTDKSLIRDEVLRNR